MAGYSIEVRTTSSPSCHESPFATVLIAWAVLARVVPETRGRPGDVMDVAGPVLAFFQVFSRWSCFSAGCCHGKPAYGLPWAVLFRHPRTHCIYRGIPVHPTQLYLSVGNLALLVVLLALWRRPWFRGRLVWVYLAGYGLLRLAVEFYRGDVRPMVGALSIYQVICLVYIAAGGAALLRACLRGRQGTAASAASPA